jgi:hypothetical protein
LVLHSLARARVQGLADAGAIILVVCVPMAAGDATNDRPDDGRDHAVSGDAT